MTGSQPLHYFNGYRVRTRPLDVDAVVGFIVVTVYVAIEKGVEPFKQRYLLETVDGFFLDCFYYLFFVVHVVFTRFRLFVLFCLVDSIRS